MFSSIYWTQAAIHVILSLSGTFGTIILYFLRMPTWGFAEGNNLLCYVYALSKHICLFIQEIRTQTECLSVLHQIGLLSHLTVITLYEETHKYPKLLVWNLCDHLKKTITCFLFFNFWLINCVKFFKPYTVLCKVSLEILTSE